MDLGVAQRLIAAGAANRLAAPGREAAGSGGARKAAQQFGALLMQNIMRQSDGTALPMVAGTGSDVVNEMFCGEISRAVMSHERMGLTDLILRSMQKKQHEAAGGQETDSAASHTAPSGTSLAAYWQGDGLRPLAGAIARGSVSPATGATLALLTNLNPRLATALGAGAPPASGGTTFEPPAGHVSGGASIEDMAAFARKLMPLLQQAGRQLGVAPRILLAQTAIETGWGRSVVGNNLFGIKAGSSWTGPKVAAATHEYEDGALISITDAFRAYPDAETSVRDFVSLVSTSPRYRAALGAGEDAAAYAQSLLAGGWATDINYVKKLHAVASSPAVTAAVAAATAPAEPAAPPVAATDGPGRPVSLLPANFAIPAR